MKKSIFLAIGLTLGMASWGTAHATNAEGENAVGRASDHLGHPIRRMERAHPSRHGRHFHPIHRLKHAHPIRRLEGR